MQDLVLDVRRGATAAALLGALVEAGASLEAVEAAVATLGRGDVRLQVHATDAGSAVRIHAPQGAPTMETWEELRPRVELLAVDEIVVQRALLVLDTLFAGRAMVHGGSPADLEVDPFSGPDDLAAAVALAAATTSLGVGEVRVSELGVGSGTMRTVEGEVELPGPVVAALVRDARTTQLDVTAEVVDPVGAAYVVACTTDVHEVTQTDTDEAASQGRGRLPDDSSLTALVVRRSAQPA